MNCRHCNEALPEDTLLCPNCGQLNMPQEEEIIVASAEEPVQQEPAAEEQVKDSPKIKKMRRMAAVSGCIAGLAVLAMVLVLGITGKWEIFDFLKPRENNVQYKDSYTVADNKAMQKNDVVVATMGDVELRNGVLQVYYWMQVYDFLEYYGYYASYYGMDYTKPLDTQEFSGGGTWQQYFLENAIKSWQTYQSLALEAEAKGYELDEEYSKLLDEMEQKLEEEAAENDFASAEELIQSQMGAGCTLADYMEYMRVYYTGYSYFNDYYKGLSFTDEQVNTYFEENKETFAASNIDKDSGIYVDVRHILIKVEELKAETDGKDGENAGTGDGDGEAADDGKVDGYTQEAWDACQAEAQAILDSWLAGEKTEDAFAKLATEKTEDTGSKETGGLYEGVKKGQMVEPFEAWCFDEARKVGDYGLVRTNYGYHIMYFVGSEEIWLAEARKAMISDATNKLVEDAVAAHGMDVEYKKIVLAEVSLA